MDVTNINSFRPVIHEKKIFNIFLLYKPILKKFPLGVAICDPRYFI